MKEARMIIKDAEEKIPRQGENQTRNALHPDHDGLPHQRRVGLCGNRAQQDQLRMFLDDMIASYAVEPENA
ncbi:hypothetical protein L207DRAFT_589520 [Hyaloscypha variabilis F]|uniref:Uncharacterized protein n=1 Tax=Hyaloscypha variabilis (strain UAMH 11265 / GT02V1 / F) TaxID=1149755 RepID=A0A2J6R621_HYAVF|nr:hypothetical protein L207DRAFT_589520 [Hyaloscypha variabilis F]